jgi:hypothetical protein
VAINIMECAPERQPQIGLWFCHEMIHHLTPMKTCTALFFASLLLQTTVRATFEMEECFLKGWMTFNGKIPFTLHVIYKPDKDRNSWVDSLTIDIAGRKTTFPADAFNGLGALLGTPSSVGKTGEKDEYSIDFLNCGDGAKSFSVNFIIRNGVLRQRHVIPNTPAEMRETVRIYDEHGAIVYDGPCDRQGRPPGKMRSEAR